MSVSLNSEQQSLETQMNSLLTDITACKASLAGINAKLDADGGVTGTNFAALWDPATLNTTAGT